MSEVTVVGLGLMGSALARTLHRAGVDVTVWNRSPDKMRPLEGQGVAAASSVTSAVAASPVLLICIDNYTSTASLLNLADVKPLIRGRTVVQFSSGTPREAREAGDAMRAMDALYLDGKLLCGPEDIGSETACIQLAGERAAYESAGAYLKHLDPQARYLGQNVAAAAAVDLAWLMTRYGNFIAMAHAALLCQSEGADVADLMAVFPEGTSARRYLGVIESGRFDQYTASLAVWGAALEHIREQGAEADIDTSVPDFIAGYFRKALDAGYGDQNVMALMKVLET